LLIIGERFPDVKLIYPGFDYPTAEVILERFPGKINQPISNYGFQYEVQQK